MATGSKVAGLGGRRRGKDRPHGGDGEGGPQPRLEELVQHRGVRAPDQLGLPDVDAAHLREDAYPQVLGEGLPRHAAGGDGEGLDHRGVPASGPTSSLASDEPPPVLHRHLVDAADVQLGAEVEREHLRALALDDRAVLLLHEALERQELLVVLVQGVVARKDPEVPCPFRSHRRRRHHEHVRVAAR